MNKILKPISDQIEALVRDVPGWTPLDQLQALFAVAFLSGDLDGDIVEVGSWCGRSAVVLGLAAQLCGRSRVHAVDLFPAKDDWKQNPDGSYSFELSIDGVTYGGYQEQTVWREAFETQTGRIYDKYDGVFSCFTETIEDRGFADIVLPHRGDLASLLRTKGKEFKCRMAFLDGDHGLNAVRGDIRNIDACLVPGGWICFDDAFTTYEGVNQAVTELIIQNPGYDLYQQMTRKLFIARKRRRIA